MYQIVVKDRYCICSVGIQDGVERWNELNESIAVQAVIQAAKTLNGVNISKQDIQIINTLDNQEIISSIHKAEDISEAEKQLLREIKIGNKVVLDSSDPRISMNVSEEDCERLVKIREGELTCSKPRPRKPKA